MKSSPAVTLAAAFTVSGALSLFSSSAHAQTVAAAPPTVVTITPNQSAVQLARTMHISVATAQQIQAIDADKDARTPTQQKISSDLIYLARMTAGKDAVPGVPKLATISKADANGNVKALVRLTPATPAAFPTSPIAGSAFITKTVKGDVTSLTNAITAVGGKVIENAGAAMVVDVPLSQLETLAARPDVGFIDLYLPPQTIGRVFGKSIADRKLRPMVPLLHKRRSRDDMRMAVAARLTRAGIPFDPFSLTGLLLNAADYNGTNTGTIDQAVVSHAVATAYSNYGVSGLNNTLSTLTTTHPGGRLRIGVLSDSDTNLSSSQTANDTPATDSSTYGTGTTSSVTIVVDDTQNPASSQDGTGEGEGTAMMEIIHDMAARCQAMFFATSANSTQQQFAKNIELLRFKYHCDIIVDDVGYLCRGSLLRRCRSAGGQSGNR